VTDDELFELDNGPPLPEELRPLIEAHHRPPETPREAIWARIAAARQAAPAPEVRPLRRAPRWSAWVTGIAALLLIGIGLGRWSVGARPTLEAGPAAPITRPSTALNVATTQHLSRIETLLTGLRTDSDTPVLATQARELLATTRLFLDAPSLTDPSLRDLLEDLELILVQVVRLQDADAPEEIEFITDGLDEHQVMLRLRRAIPAGPIRI